jgi:anti-anti-sigma factor
MALAPERTQFSPLSRGEPSIEVHLDRARVGDFSAVVALFGEHDLATAEAVRVALAPLCGRVLVDLTDCSFIDSTIISILINKATSLKRDGHELELRVPADSIVARALAIIGLARFLTVRAAS